MHTVKPLDREAIARAAAETGAIVVAEEHLVDGGLGVRVAQVVAETRPCAMEFVGIQETYAESGQPDELLEKYGLVAQECGGRGSQSGRAQRIIEHLRLPQRWPTPPSSDAFLEQSPACHWVVDRPACFHRFYGDPRRFSASAPAIFSAACGGAPARAVAQPGRTALRALSRRVAAPSGAPWRRDSGNLRISRSASRAAFDMPASLAREVSAWSTAEQELRHTVLGALKAMEFERKSLRNSCTIKSDRT